MTRSLSILGLLACIFLASCARETKLRAINQSSSLLSDIVISGTGFSERIGQLEPGAQRLANINPRGESGLKVAFVAAGKHYDTGEQGYFEDGDDVSAVIAPDFTVTVTANLPTY